MVYDKDDRIAQIMNYEDGVLNGAYHIYENGVLIALVIMLMDCERVMRIFMNKICPFSKLVIGKDKKNMAWR